MNLMTVVYYLKKSLNIPESPDSWTRIGIHAHDQFSALALLVHISHAVGANLALPSNVSIAVMKSEMVDGMRKNKTSIHVITTNDEASFAIDATLSPATDALLIRDEYEEDAFDELMDSPEKQDQITEVCVEVNGG
jgi:hypothetical protein